MLQPLRAIAVIGHEDEALGVVIQTPDVKKPPKFLREQLINRAPALRVAARRQVTRRLVERDPNRCRRLNYLAVQLYAIYGRIDPSAQLGDDLSIHTDAAGGDQ